jgi:hypothetical protein
VTRLRTDGRWDFRELPLGHLGLLYDPVVVAQALHDLTMQRSPPPVITVVGTRSCPASRKPCQRGLPPYAKRQ